MLVMAAIAYASCRHGVDADVGLAREALAMLCQESINFTESLPMEEMQKRPAVHLHLGNGARP